jgi:hypothetical protein
VKLSDFVNALHRDFSLERLDINGGISALQGIWEDIAASLLENEGLTHLGLRFCEFGGCKWSKLLEAILPRLDA